jgi:type III secretion protein J
MQYPILSRLAPALTALCILAGCQTEIYSNVSEREANEMLAVLLAQNISASKVAIGDGTFSLTVEETELKQALTFLDNKGLPRVGRETIGQVFSGGGIVSSPFEERVRYIYALGEDVAQTLQEIDGVLVARVHIVMPEEAALGQDAKPASAAIFIKQQAGYDLDFLVPQIRRLVANSIEGVNYEAITVVLVEATAETLTPPDAPQTVRTMGLEVGRGSIVKLRTSALIGTLAFLVALGAIAALAYVNHRLRKSIKPDEEE